MVDIADTILSKIVFEYPSKKDALSVEILDVSKDFIQRF